jgi:hypothetical protein
MKKSIFLLLVTSFTLFWCSYGQADANKVVYELQERCGKTASEVFKKEYGSGLSSDENATRTSDYTNHYNAKLNKCFIVIRETTFTKNKEIGWYLNRFLIDVNENKEYGSFAKFQKELKPQSCVVGVRQCSSEAEWDALIKPYMEE